MPDAEDANNVHEDAEIRVEPPNIMYGDSPYTLQTGECGEEGQYTQVSIMSSLSLDTIYHLCITDIRELLERACG